MTWLRLEAAYFSNPAMVRAGWDGKVAFLALLTMSKLHNMSGGVIDKEDCDPEILRSHLGVPESRHSDEQLRNGIDSCVRAGLLIDDGSAYSIRAWGKHQIDRTAAERAQRYRDKKKRKASVTVTNGNHDIQDGTGRDIQDKQDRTGQPLACSSLSPKQKACVVGILDALCRGEDGKRNQDSALHWRRLNRVGDLEDDVAKEILDKWLKRFKGAAADAKKAAGL